ncbi:MAG: hypothetical protein H6707_11005 [Deltaproteobacteria bacterium]|nr:hypothetical protein [Deltaproteobacteria bacterium]
MGTSRPQDEAPSTQHYAKWEGERPVEWENIRMWFLNGQEVAISVCGGKRATYDLTEGPGMLLTSTKTTLTLSGQILLLLAKQDGAVFNENSLEDGMVNKDRIYELNRRLRDFFGLSQRPIIKDTIHGGWKCLFRIYPESVE